ncbi:hypothetical protein ABK040_010937 [Willaertia magna]
MIGCSLGFLLSNQQHPLWQQAATLWIGIAFGFVLLQSAYGFTAQFRLGYNLQYDFIYKKNIHDNQYLTEIEKAKPKYSGIQAHCLMLAISSFLFGALYLLDKICGWGRYTNEASPITISILMGGFLFGIGMQVGDVCASGTLFTLGGGSLWSLLLLIFFVIGGTFGTYFFSAGNGVWNIGFPKNSGFSFLFPGMFLKKAYHITYIQQHPWLEYFIAVLTLCIQVGCFIAAFVGIHFYNKKRKEQLESLKIEASYNTVGETQGLLSGQNKTPNSEEEEEDDEMLSNTAAFRKVNSTKSTMDKVKSFLKVVAFGPWDYLVGAVLMALLNFIHLLVTQHGMGITGPFFLIGSKILNGIAPSLHVENWKVWQGQNLNGINVVTNLGCLFDFGIVMGAMMVALLRGTFPSVLQDVKFPCLNKKQKLYEVIKESNTTDRDVNDLVINDNSKKQEMKSNNKQQQDNNTSNYIKEIALMSLAKMIGGICMGLGARFGYGCNINAYFSGVSNFSVHAYVWITLAIIGGYFGALSRPLFGYKKKVIECGCSKDFIKQVY